MNKDDFIAKAKEYGYDDEEIKGLLETYNEMKAINPSASYADVVLIQQAVY